MQIFALSAWKRLWESLGADFVFKLESSKLKTSLEALRGPRLLFKLEASLEIHRYRECLSKLENIFAILRCRALLFQLGNLYGNP